MNLQLMNAVSITGLNKVLKQIYESERIAKKKNTTVPQFIIPDISDRNTKINQGIVNELVEINDLMSAIYEYQEDVLTVGSESIKATDQFIKLLFKDFEVQLSEDSFQENSSLLENLNDLKLSAQDSLIRIIKGTQVHVILVDEFPLLEKGKTLCNKFLSVSSLGNALIQYCDQSQYQSIFNKYQCLPSIYILINYSPMEQTFINLLKRFALYPKESFKQCYIMSTTHQKSDVKKYLNSLSFYIVSNYVDLLAQVRADIDKPSSEKIQSCIPLSQKYRFNILTILGQYNNLDYNQSVASLFQLKDQISKTYQIQSIKNSNQQDLIYFQFLSSLQKCFEEYQQPQPLSKKILQHFEKYKSHVNRIIELNDSSLIDQYQILICAVVLAYKVFKDHEQEDFDKTISRAMLLQGLTISYEEGNKYLMPGNKVLLPRFSEFNFHYCRAEQQFTISPPPQGFTNILLTCMYEANDYFPNRIKIFKALDSANFVCMCLPNTEFEVSEIQNKRGYTSVILK